MWVLCVFIVLILESCATIKISTDQFAALFNGVTIDIPIQTRHKGAKTVSLTLRINTKQDSPNTISTIPVGFKLSWKQDNKCYLNFLHKTADHSAEELLQAAFYIARTSGCTEMSLIDAADFYCDGKVPDYHYFTGTARFWLPLSVDVLTEDKLTAYSAYGFKPSCGEIDSIEKYMKIVKKFRSISLEKLLAENVEGAKKQLTLRSEKAYKNLGLDLRELANIRPVPSSLKPISTSDDAFSVGIHGFMFLSDYYTKKPETNKKPLEQLTLGEFVKALKPDHKCALQTTIEDYFTFMDITAEQEKNDMYKIITTIRSCRTWIKQL